MRLCWNAIAAAIVCGACAPSQYGPSIVQFPSRQQLAAVAKRPAEPPEYLERAAVERWQPAIAPGAPGPTAWDAMLAGAVRSHGSASRIAAELGCAANEIARFVAERGALPEQSLQEFLVARCGSSLPFVRVYFVQRPGAGPPNAGPLEANLEVELNELLAGVLSTRAHQVGVGYARAGERHAFVACAGTPRGNLQTETRVITGSTMTLEGELPRDTHFMIGIANRGRYAFTECVPDPRVGLPRFRLSCPIAEDDAATFIEVGTRTEKQALFRVALRVLVRRAEAHEPIYELPEYDSSAEVSVANALAFRDRLLKLLNQVRRSAQLQPLALELKQSNTNQRLAPYLFESLFDAKEERSDLIALGLLAGWDVAGDIQGAGVSASVATSRSPRLWLARALQSPLGRSVLLAPDTSRAAIGAVSLGRRSAFGVVTTYSMFRGSQDHAADEASVFEALVRARRALGLPRPRRIPTGYALREALDEIATGDETSTAALDEALETIGRLDFRSTGGYIFETVRLSQIRFPGELLRPGPLDVAVGVTHYKAPGAAWAQYSVLFVVYGIDYYRFKNAAQAPRDGRRL